MGAWHENPPAQPRWRRLDRFDSIYGGEWRASEWRLELSRLTKRRAFAKRRIAGFTRNRPPLTERAASYHGMRFNVRVTWQARS
jgi:hypothetical protein